MARLPPPKLVGGLGFWGKGRTKRRIVVGCRSVLLVCCSREHSMVSHNTVSFLLEVPGQKDWVCLQTRVRTVCITYVNMHMASLHHLMQWFQFPRPAFPPLFILLEKQLEKGVLENDIKKGVYASAWNKVWYISCGGKGKIFYRVLYTEHSHLLNTAKEITHLLSTWNYKKNCSLWTPPIESPQTQSDICFALC